MIVGPVCDRQPAHEKRHRAKNDSQHDQHFRDEKTGKGEGKPNGQYATKQSKLVDRGMRMIMEELQLDEKKAKQLLQKYGSVKKVLDIYNKK